MNIEVKETRACKFAGSLFVARHEGAGESGGTILRILSLCNKLGVWSASRLGHFTPGRESPVHIKEKAGWATEPVRLSGIWNLLLLS
jgi:hypothetical protein